MAAHPLAPPPFPSFPSSLHLLQYTRRSKAHFFSGYTTKVVGIDVVEGSLVFAETIKKTTKAPVTTLVVEQKGV
jgi:hypothetical protein